MWKHFSHEADIGVLGLGDTREAVGDLQAGIWMKVRGEPTIWIVNEYTVKNIFKTEEDLLPDQE